MIEYEENIDLKKIEKYMFKTYIEDVKNKENNSNTENTENRENIKDNKKKINNEYFSKYNNKYNGKINKELKENHKKIDRYFWYFYNKINNIEEDDFNNTRNNMFSIEKDYKINFVEIIRKNKNKLKSYKLKLSELEDEFVNNNFITLKGLYALCIMNKINLLVYYENKTYNKLYYNNEQDVSYIVFIDKKKNILDKSLDKDFYNNIINNYYYVENIDKPINSLTYYKLEELQNIAEKLCINMYDSGKKYKKKKDLYEEILNRLII